MGGIFGPRETRLDQGESRLEEQHERPREQRPGEVNCDLVLANLVSNGRESVLIKLRRRLNAVIRTGASLVAARVTITVGVSAAGWRGCGIGRICVCRQRSHG